jgi:signal transduction histidine kinase
MVQMTKLLASKSSLVGVLLLGGLIFTTYNIQENSAQMKKLSNFESGVQTCFARVNQTYTAKLIGDATSTYLTQNFQNLTEECFAEGILNIEESFKSELSSVAKKLSTLASNVHWFHEDVLSPSGSHKLTGDGEDLDIGSRFEKIEATKDEILEASDNRKTELSNALNKQKTFFYVSSVLLVLLMMSEYFSNSKRRSLNLQRESEAESELFNNGGITSVRIGEIIRSALEQNELTNCSKLFTNYHNHNVLDKTIRGKGKVNLEALVTPIGPKAISVQSKDQIEKIWNDDNVGLDIDSKHEVNLDQINLEQQCSNVIDLLSDKLFSTGVKLDFQINENIFVKAKQEELEQILYHLFSFAIGSSLPKQNSRSVNVSAHRLGDVVAFDLTYSGAGFDEDILKQKAGLSQTDKKLNVDLQICQSLVEEIQAKIQYDNKLDQKGEVVGGRVKMIFKSAPNNAKLVNLKVGSKKEILASMGTGPSASI